MKTEHNKKKICRSRFTKKQNKRGSKPISRRFIKKHNKGGSGLMNRTSTMTKKMSKQILPILLHNVPQSLTKIDYKRFVQPQHKMPALKYDKYTNFKQKDFSNLNYKSLDVNKIVKDVLKSSPPHLPPSTHLPSTHLPPKNNNLYYSTPNHIIKYDKLINYNNKKSDDSNYRSKKYYSSNCSPNYNCQNFYYKINLWNLTDEERLIIELYEDTGFKDWVEETLGIKISLKPTEQNFKNVISSSIKKILEVIIMSSIEKSNDYNKSDGKSFLTECKKEIDSIPTNDKTKEILLDNIKNFYSNEKDLIDNITFTENTKATDLETINNLKKSYFDTPETDTENRNLIREQFEKESLLFKEKYGEIP
jgi:hypothetical protein